MAPAIRGGVHQLADLTHPGRHELASFQLTTDLENERADEVQLEAIDVVPLYGFVDQLPVVLADLRVGPIPGVELAAEDTLRMPTKLRVLSPESAQRGGLALYRVVMVVHANRYPRRHPLLACPGEVRLHVVDPQSGQLRKRFDPPAVSHDDVRHTVAEERLVVRTVRVEALPVRLPDLAGVVGLVDVDVLHEVRHARMGDCVDPVMDDLFAHLVAWVKATQIHAVFVVDQLCHLVSLRSTPAGLRSKVVVSPKPTFSPDQSGQLKPTRMASGRGPSTSAGGNSNR